MIYVQKQANLSTLGDGDVEIYKATTNAQVRAFTVYNPSDKDNVICVVKVNDKELATKTLMPKKEIVLSFLFNQQIKPNDKIVVNGKGLNVMLTVTEIVD